MKRLLISLLLGLFLFSFTESKAQSFIVVNDTIHYAATPIDETIFDTIVTVSSAVRYSWKVIACNFPADWLMPAASAFCDNNVCINLPVLWPSGMVDSTAPYAAGDTSVLDLVLDLGPTATPGCYYVTVRLNNIGITADSAIETWYVCYAGATTNVSYIYAQSIGIYPNPAYDELTVQYGNSGSSKIRIYDLFGKVVVEQQGINGSAVISLTNIPNGIYFARLINSQGAIIASKKFIKE